MPENVDQTPVIPVAENNLVPSQQNTPINTMDQSYVSHNISEPRRHFNPKSLIFIIVSILILVAISGALAVVLMRMNNNEKAQQTEVTQSAEVIESGSRADDQRVNPNPNGDSSQIKLYPFQSTEQGISDRFVDIYTAGAMSIIVTDPKGKTTTVGPTSLAYVTSENVRIEADSAISYKIQLSDLKESNYKVRFSDYENLEGLNSIEIYYFEMPAQDIDSARGSLMQTHMLLMELPKNSDYFEMEISEKGVYVSDLYTPYAINRGPNFDMIPPVIEVASYDNSSKKVTLKATDDVQLKDFKCAYLSMKDEQFDINTKLSDFKAYTDPLVIENQDGQKLGCMAFDSSGNLMYWFSWESDLNSITQPQLDYSGISVQ